MSIYEFAMSIARLAGEKIREQLSHELVIETKSNPNDLVTNMDKATEAFLVAEITKHYPDHQIIGEEGHGKTITSTDGYLWVIDPIDGTLNFVHQQQNFAISIGIFHNGEKYAGIVYDVIDDKMYHAQAGQGAYLNDRPLPMLKETQLATSIISMNPNWLTKDYTYEMYAPIIRTARSARSYGSAALDFAYVALGIIDSYITLRLHPWDFSGGMIIAEEVGAVVTNQLGDKLDPLHSNSILVANSSLHKEILEQYLEPHHTALESIHKGTFSNR
ncbi:inositol monophosphatase family protein [Macrococcus hajekii]|uniref:Inositol monophosphatase family protein n=1 Tax=Macrococcus hajekii TaxID=198482 RepID=A0A4R6BN75_9STAP|nr:inositol monophosphatase family protein [Macrococcus hajekii]TDM03314.1 inositol monophosphatase family protein [Macrococcus hajekii]GGA97830.1 inositol monophosphatase [Macrococcus hajekii]